MINSLLITFDGVTVLPGLYMYIYRYCLNTIIEHFTSYDFIKPHRKTDKVQPHRRNTLVLVGPMLGQRRRCWPSIGPTKDQRIEPCVIPCIVTRLRQGSLSGKNCYYLGCS